ncbi:putative ADP-ribosylation factor GTPase-activating protein AGD11 [Acorus calamus]|uniref:ADP-ribosylation factor GTPase-activating protein AGD11 n=1 Tax=Acorus calamus TaxID=4465 RepID=A0AAV9FGU4_ACOCL|nr:putative ADP-ribosylation factor GTPase-activating protein AGD11 [Acorus calamus]
MEKVLGLLRVRVIRGVNLANRDLRSSDPYVVLIMGNQLPVIAIAAQSHNQTHPKKNLNPEWNEELTLAVVDPTLTVKLELYDKDTLGLDDRMGDAEFEIQPFVEAVKAHEEHPEEVPSGNIIRRLAPSRQNCLAEDSSIVWVDGKIVQYITLRLRNVECGEVELQLQ